MKRRMTVISIVTPNTSSLWAVQADIAGPGVRVAFGSRVCALPNGKIVDATPYWKGSGGVDRHA